MSPPLGAAIDELYAAFARERRPKAIDYCAHCVSADDIKRLLVNRPLREIPAETMRPYAVDMLSTVGSVSDFRYFFPRVLHIAVTEGFDYLPDLEQVLGRLPMASWLDWPARERQAIVGITRAAWSHTLTLFPADAEPVLRAAGRLEADLTPYLEAWEDALTRYAGASHLLAFVRDHFGRAGTEFWLTVPGWQESASAAMRDWLGGTRLVELVAAAAESANDERTAEILLEVLVEL